MPQVTFFPSAPPGPTPSRFHPIRPTATRAFLGGPVGCAVRARNTGSALLAAFRPALEHGFQSEVLWGM
ncbi:hypothetical protein CLIM01_03751 [Colletotrichum limetticola]|uniref:Uncharacterized protein n=1 Tax=Colletotrichum limetticola TaxID=1209924 RepID=A0ABQ9Q518_9PEZI|nr:hypothetical protein CLIM01_03751 [Colletotrichum limetticola]